MSQSGAPLFSTYKLVFPEHLNQFGFLFGGNLLKWVDETAWMAASSDFPGHHFVTVALDRVVFHKSAQGGNVLRFDITRDRLGKTSVTYRVDVVRRCLETGVDESIFCTNITFVRVDDQGNKMAVDRV